jgi:hypothetical protein
MKVQKLLIVLALSLITSSATVSSFAITTSGDQTQLASQVVVVGKQCAQNITETDLGKVEQQCISCCTTKGAYDREAGTGCIFSCTDTIKQKLLEQSETSCAAPIPNNGDETAITTSCKTCCDKNTGILGSPFYQKCQPECITKVKAKQKIETKAVTTVEKSQQSETATCHYHSAILGDFTQNNLSKADCDALITKIKEQEKKNAGVNTIQQENIVTKAFTLPVKTTGTSTSTCDSAYNACMSKQGHTGCQKQRAQCMNSIMPEKPSAALLSPQQINKLCSTKFTLAVCKKQGWTLQRCVAEIKACITNKGK